MTKKLVSVIMASFNESPDIITASIDSIIQQTHKAFELLIFDDSTDERTREAIDSFRSDSRVKIFRSDKRLGFVSSLNMGLEKAQGEYIARMDGDDIALPERLEKEVVFLEKHKNIYVVGGQIDIINDQGEIISSRKYPVAGVKLYLFSALRNPLAHPTIMMRRELIDKGFRYDEKLKMSEDLDLWLRIMNAGYRIANIPDTVLRYRVADNFIEKRSNRVQVEYMAKVRKQNFDKRHLVHSSLSCFCGWVFKTIPVEVIRSLYKNENKQ